MLKKSFPSFAFYPLKNYMYFCYHPSLLKFWSCRLGRQGQTGHFFELSRIEWSWGCVQAETAHVWRYFRRAAFHCWLTHKKFSRAWSSGSKSSAHHWRDRNISSNELVLAVVDSISWARERHVKGKPNGSENLEFANHCSAQVEKEYR